MSLPGYIIIVCIFLLTSCNSQRQEALVYGGETMGTTYSITLINTDSENTRINQGEVDQLLESINLSMSTYINDSELSRLNQSDSTDWQAISEDLYQVLSTAQTINLQTDGAFDVTIGSIINLWGFGPENVQQAIPDTEMIMSGLRNSGHNHISLRQNPKGIKKDNSEIYLDLSAIAKGYAVDRIADLVEQQGFDNYMVEIGGEVRAKGHNRQGEAWRIGIEKPKVEGREVQRVIALDNLSLATSGDYRNFFEYDGERYSHTIDPATGWPVKQRDMSVTVIHESAMIADALATALTVMGISSGLSFANQQDLAVLYIQRNGEIYSETSSQTFTQIFDR